MSIWRDLFESLHPSGRNLDWKPRVPFKVICALDHSRPANPTPSYQRPRLPCEVIENPPAVFLSVAASATSKAEGKRKGRRAMTGARFRQVCDRTRWSIARSHGTHHLSRSRLQ